MTSWEEEIYEKLYELNDNDELCHEHMKLIKEQIKNVVDIIYTDYEYLTVKERDDILQSIGINYD